jgi:hypothetical protein
MREDGGWKEQYPPIERRSAALRSEATAVRNGVELVDRRCSLLAIRKAPKREGEGKMNLALSLIYFMSTNI